MFLCIHIFLHVFSSNDLCLSYEYVFYIFEKNIFALVVGLQRIYVLAMNIFPDCPILGSGQNVSKTTLLQSPLISYMGLL